MADAALRSHLDALVNEWKAAQKDREDRTADRGRAPPAPTGEPFHERWFQLPHLH